MMDEQFRQWLIARGEDPDRSQQRLSELRVEYEEEQQDDEAEQSNLENFAYYMLGMGCNESSNAIDQYESWWAEASHNHDS